MFRIDRQLLDPKLIEIAKREILQSIEQLGPNTPAHEIYQRQGGIRLSSCGSTIEQLAKLLQSFAGYPANLDRSSCRTQEPCDPKHFAWHQDYIAMDLKPGHDGMVAWVPLDPIDGTRPTLQIGDDLPPLPHHRDARRFVVADKQDCTAIETLTDLMPGDVVWLGPYTFHRSYSTPDMINSRMSLDMRFSSQWASDGGQS